jgi:hypothetical protein
MPARVMCPDLFHVARPRQTRIHGFATCFLATFLWPKPRRLTGYALAHNQSIALSPRFYRGLASPLRPYRPPSPTTFGTRLRFSPSSPPTGHPVAARCRQGPQAQIDRGAHPPRSDRRRLRAVVMVEQVRANTDIEASAATSLRRLGQRNEAASAARPRCAPQDRCRPARRRHCRHRRFPKVLG